MSRVKKLKERKGRRINKLKIAAVSLTLTLTISSTQALGTYALFTDTEDLVSDLSISTGDVDVEVNKGFDKTDVQSGHTFTHNVIITNNGTSNQNIRLELEKKLDYVDYSVDFVDEKIADLASLSIVEQNITNADGTLFVLPPGEQVNATINIRIGEIPKDVYNTTENIKLVVLASQINKANTIVKNGFYDIAIQQNTINFIGKENIITSDKGQIKVAGLGEGNNFLKIDYIKGAFTIPTSIKFVEGTGKFENSKVRLDSNNTFDIFDVSVYDKKNKNYLFEDKYGVDRITIDFIYKDKILRVYFDFRLAEKVHGNRAAIAKYTITEPLKTIIKEKSQQNLEQTIMEDIEESSQVETTQPSQQEVVESPKSEETPEPVQPKITEQPIDNENIQE